MSNFLNFCTQTTPGKVELCKLNNTRCSNYSATKQITGSHARPRHRKNVRKRNFQHDIQIITSAISVNREGNRLETEFKPF